jgi:hypothetical protein
VTIKILKGDKPAGELNDALEFTGSDDALRKTIDRFRVTGFTVMWPGRSTDEKIVDDFRHLDFGPDSVGVLASELLDLGYDVEEVE